MRLILIHILAFSLSSLLGQRPFPYKHSATIAEEYETSEESWKDQVAAWDASYIGAYQEALEYWDASAQVGPPLTPEDSAYFTRFHPVDALKFIVRRASQHQVAVINEAHHQPMHRVFIMRLLQGLYDRGYRYLGLETLDYLDKEINDRGYPILSSGYYSVEPQLGNLIRKALQIGYQVFAYEAEATGVDEREKGQAKNIAEFMKNHSDGKVLIHCGFAHVGEKEVPGWGIPMAAQLKEYVGQDPLTINQDRLTERKSLELANPYMRLTEVRKPSVFVSDDGTVFNGPEGIDEFDLRVMHPFTRMVGGRPHWLCEDTDKILSDPDLSELEVSFPALVLAFHLEESADAVPADVIERISARDRKPLSLAPGQYLLRVISTGGEEKELEWTVSK